VPLQSRRVHARTAVLLFAALGAQVGAFAVLVPDLAASRGLTPAALGGALAVMAAASIATLAAAGPLADRYGRRPLLVGGTAAFALAFALLAGVEAPAALWPTLAVYGIASGCLDLGANAVGSDYERTHDVRAMIRLHAGFSAAAAVLALGAALLASAAGHESAYTAMAAGYALLAIAAVRLPLPPHENAGGGDSSAPADSPPPAGRLALLRLPGVALATAICTLCFFGDGAIEGFSALLLRGDQGASAIGVGLSLAAFHAASLAGRLGFARLADARGDGWILTAAGTLACAAMVTLIAARAPLLAGVALLVVGFALGPVIPTVLSLAGRSAPDRAGAAVSLVTTIGYSAFVLGPPVVGAVAQVTSLRAALLLVVASTAAFALLGRRVAPTPASRRPPRARRRRGRSTR
jgi:predicted MFS family arabinose efflux permease